ncbi:hypothetical protein SAMD00023353_6000070 [Rosellinia necatrix]|uniref:Tim44-like domain-containing protein n=1 Tax=Rosellinia necatrix TaxID=77044 RepID=A0A1W2TS90_ROSNE|nr:hypothetical protein SAMD00023353_6000070 [Rosellinia necatrix]
MAGLARIARPWLSPSRQPVRASALAALYSGLGQGRGISSTAAGRSNLARVKEKLDAERMHVGNLKKADNAVSMLLPFTVVAPPVWRFPPSPAKAGWLVWNLAKNRVTSLGALLGVYIMSMRLNGYGMPVFRAKKGQCIPAAKVLHMQMSEAVATGDKETLRRICTAELFHILASTIDTRPAGIRTEWELVRYSHKLRYPRLADFRVMMAPTSTTGEMKLVKQAVVSIASVQRIVRYDDGRGGEKVPGSEREREMMEHFVIQAPVKTPSFETSAWKVWGTIPEATYESLREDIRLFT